MSPTVPIGLRQEEAAARLARYGSNELIDTGQKKAWRILWEQVTATLVLVLVAAAILSAVVKDYQDAIVIVVIVLLNVSLGFIQEFKAEKAIGALKKLTLPAVRVWRDGKISEMSSRLLVPGDAVLLEAGNRVPADGHLVESVGLRIDESALTGESEPVDKDTRDRVYLGTIVTYGRGTVLIERTGMKTELGRLAKTLQTIQAESTPLQKRFEELAKRLTYIVLGIVAVVFTLGLLRGEHPHLMFLTAIGIAVAAIPEGLPAVITISLALGAQRMLKRRALVRKLSAVEALGSVTVICTDKTGTLTENRMKVAFLDIAGHRVDLTEQVKSGGMVLETRADLSAQLHDHPALSLLLTGAALCSEARLEQSPESAGGWHAVGDPTETALVAAAAQFGLWKTELDQALPRVTERPFDSTRKRMSTAHPAPLDGFSSEAPAIQAVRSIVGGPGSYVTFTKGSVDGLLDISSSVWIEGHSEPLDARWRQRILKSHDELAHKGMRVMGVAFRTGRHAKGNNVLEESDMTFVGFAGMSDPPRPEVRDALSQCRQAGIRVIMITGDHPATAQAIAAELDIPTEKVVIGQDLQKMSSQELMETLRSVSVFARVVPEDKLRLVEALQAQGHRVAMTGDGINDAPALKKANISVAMGRGGTDIARETADIVLLDDNFATIVAAIAEGRTIYDNIRKFVKYLLTTNTAEVCVMLIGPFLGIPLPLLPLQILWINLVTDGPPALALSLEPPETNSMRRAPRPLTESIFGAGVGRHMAWAGLFMCAVSLAVGYGYWHSGRENWQTMIFTTLTFSQLANVLAIRAGNQSLFHRNQLHNPVLYGVVFCLGLLQAAVLYIPQARQLLQTLPLSAEDLGLSLVASALTFGAIEIEKGIIRFYDVAKASR